jgi:hypothetical protein
MFLSYLGTWSVSRDTRGVSVYVLSFTMPRGFVALSLWSAETLFIRLIVVHAVFLRVTLVYGPIRIHLGPILKMPVNLVLESSLGMMEKALAATLTYA